MIWLIKVVNNLLTCFDTIYEWHVDVQYDHTIVRPYSAFHRLDGLQPVISRLNVVKVVG